MRRWDFSLAGTICTRCNGKGQVEEVRDLHRSAGIIPCPGGYFQGHGFPMCFKGKLRFDDYDVKHVVRLMKQYPPKLEKKADPAPKRRRRVIRVRYGAREYPF